MSSTAQRIDRNAWQIGRQRRNWQRIAQSVANVTIPLNPSSTNALFLSSTGYAVLVDGTSITMNSTTHVISAAGGVSGVVAGDGSISTSTGGGSTAIVVRENSTGGISTSPTGIGILRCYDIVPNSTVVVSVLTSTSTNAFRSTGGWGCSWQLGSTFATASTNALHAQLTPGNTAKLQLVQGSTVLASTTTFTLPGSTNHLLTLSTSPATQMALVQVDGSTILGPVAYTSTNDAQAGFYGFYALDDPPPVTQFTVSADGTNLFQDNYPDAYNTSSTLTQNNSTYVTTYKNGSVTPYLQYSSPTTTDKTQIKTYGLVIFVNSADTQCIRYNQNLSSTHLIQDSGLSLGSTGLCVNPDGSTIIIDSTNNTLHVLASAFGTVTSVALSLPSTVFTVTGSPVTTSGTLTATFANQASTLFFAGPASGANAAPTFRAIVAADVGLTAAGDLLTVNSTVTLTRLGIGSNAQVLTVDTSLTSKLKWATPTTGTVTSVDLTMPSTVFTITGNPITASGTLTVTFANQSSSQFFAGPASGAAAAPTFRNIVANDIGLTTKGDLATVNSTAALAKLGVGTDGQVLVSDSSTLVGLAWSTLNLAVLGGVLPVFAAPPSTNGQALYRSDLQYAQIQTASTVENFSRSSSWFTTSTNQGSTNQQYTVASTMLPPGYLIPGRILRFKVWGSRTDTTAAGSFTIGYSISTGSTDNRSSTAVLNNIGTALGYLYQGEIAFQSSTTLGYGAFTALSQTGGVQSKFEPNFSTVAQSGTNLATQSTLVYIFVINTGANIASTSTYGSYIEFLN